MSTFHLMRNVLFASFRVQICSDSSVAFRLLAFWKDVLLCCGFGIVWCQSHLRFCCCFRRLIDHVLLEAFTIKWAFCFLPAVAALVMILVWGRCYNWESGEYVFVMWCDDGFHVWHAWVAEFYCVSAWGSICRQWIKISVQLTIFKSPIFSIHWYKHSNINLLILSQILLLRSINDMKHDLAKQSSVSSKAQLTKRFPSWTN